MTAGAPCWLVLCAGGSSANGTGNSRLRLRRCCGRRVGQVANAWMVTSSPRGVLAGVGDLAGVGEADEQLAEVITDRLLPPPELSLARKVSGRAAGRGVLRPGVAVADGLRGSSRWPSISGSYVKTVRRSSHTCRLRAPADVSAGCRCGFSTGEVRSQPLGNVKSSSRRVREGRESRRNRYRCGWYG